MAAYLITKSDSKLLDTPVFAADQVDEIVTVFTDPKNAQQYIDDAGWSEDHTVATLDSIAFMEWLLHCHRSGIELMATDLKRSDHDAGRKISSLNIKAHLEHAGEHVVLTANRDF
jgi:hypothetical protein